MVSFSYISRLGSIPRNVNLPRLTVRRHIHGESDADGVESLQKALNLDLEYVQLQHMCLVRSFPR